MRGVAAAARKILSRSSRAPHFISDQSFFQAPGSRPSPARTSEGVPNRRMDLCIIDEFYGRVFAKAHLKCKRRWFILSFVS